MNPSVLVVEDERAIQELLVMNLRHAGFLAVPASSAEEGESAIRAALPDLVILDWMLGGQSGVTLARKLRQHERTREMPILMLTAQGQEDGDIQGLDYVSKPFSLKDVVGRVRAMLRRRPPQLAGEAVESGGVVLDPANRRVTVGGKTVELGPTELRLLYFLMTHAEQVYSRAQLRDEVWGTQVFIEERTVDVSIRRLRAALESSGHHLRVETVRGTGYRFRST